MAAARYANPLCAAGEETHRRREKLCEFVGRREACAHELLIGFRLVKLDKSGRNNNIDMSNVTFTAANAHIFSRLPHGDVGTKARETLRSGVELRAGFIRRRSNRQSIS